MRKSRPLAALAAGLAIVFGVALPAGATPSPDPDAANASILAACAVPSVHDPYMTLTVYRIARNHNVNDKVMLAAFETGWVESHMNNLTCGDKDSRGVFQQRPSQGWGTEAQILDPAYAATQFITRAINNDRNNPGYSPGQLAQSVQRSGHPERYDQAEAKARSMLDEARRMHMMQSGSPADFNGDGKDDIVTFTKNAAADVFVALSTGNGFSGTSVKWHDFFGLGGETTLTGDFNGDGKDDIITFTHGSLGDVYVATSNGNGFNASGKWHDWFAPGGEIAAVGDFNGDGKDDIATFTRGGGADVYIALSNGSGFGPGLKWHDFFAVNGEFPATGDVNGDGKDDIIVFTQGGGADVYWAQSTGSGFQSSAKVHDWFAPAGELPRVGDFNGDHKADLVTFTNNAAADAYVALSTGTGYGAGVKWNDHFGLPGEFPYTGDYDGDGKDDVITFTLGNTNDVYVGISTATSFGTGAKWHDWFGLNGESTL